MDLSVGNACRAIANAYRVAIFGAGASIGGKIVGSIF